MLSEYAGNTALPRLVQQAFDRIEFLNSVTNISRNLRRQADIIVLRGILALEEGAVKDAKNAFREPLSFWKDAKTAATGGGLDFNGRVIAQTCLEWLE